VPVEGGEVAARPEVHRHASPVLREVEAGVRVVVDLEGVGSRGDAAEVQVTARVHVRDFLEGGVVEDPEDDAGHGGGGPA